MVAQVAPNQAKTNDMASVINGVVVTDAVLKRNSLSAKISLTEKDERYYNGQVIQRASPQFIISNAAHFQIQVITRREYKQVSHYHMIYLLFTKRRADDELTYRIKLTIEEFGIKNKCFTSENDTWHLIHEKSARDFSFSLHVSMEVAPRVISFAELHDDTELTDFELRGEDGSVHVHRVVLALASPVFRRMLSGGAWRESSTGHVDIPSFSKSTLEHLKTYIYLHELPEHGLEQLLLLSSCYIMPDLESKCIENLVQNLRAEDVCEMIEFATKNKATKLLVAVLECVQDGAVKVADISDHVTGVGAPNTKVAENCSKCQ